MRSTFALTILLAVVTGQEAAVQTETELASIDEPVADTAVADELDEVSRPENGSMLDTSSPTEQLMPEEQDARE